MNLNKAFESYSDIKSDEFHTPDILILPLLKYIKPKSTIWCPCDEADKSLYVKIFLEAGHQVISSHVNNHQDFLRWQPTVKYDYIITNIPFSLKKNFLFRAIELKKPFAFLFPLPALNYQEIAELLCNFQKKGNSLEEIKFDKKVSFNGSTSSFAVMYLCHKILKENQNLYINLADNNSGNFYRPNGESSKRDIFENKNQKSLF